MEFLSLANFNQNNMPATPVVSRGSLWKHSQEAAS